MSTIIVGHFSDSAQLEQALAALPGRGFSRREFASYYLNPPGQHGLYPLGGDADSDEGAADAGKGAATAAVIGGAAGLAIGTTVAGPVGALAGAGVGAYVGSLAGALGRTHSPHLGAASVEHPVEPPAGPAVCVCADRPGAETAAVSVLTEAGACRVERAVGTWSDGNWQDHDPRRPVDVLYSTIGETGHAPGAPGTPGP